MLREEEDYVVIDKPGGVPTVPTVDNLYENCLHMTGRAIEARGPLRVTHRLDQPTSGGLVLAKTKAFCSHFNQLLSERGEGEDKLLTRKLDICSHPRMSGVEVVWRSLLL